MAECAPYPVCSDQADGQVALNARGRAESGCAETLGEGRARRKPGAEQHGGCVRFGLSGACDCTRLIFPCTCQSSSARCSRGVSHGKLVMKARLLLVLLASRTASGYVGSLAQAVAAGESTTAEQLLREYPLLATIASSKTSRLLHVATPLNQCVLLSRVDALRTMTASAQSSTR